MLSQHTETQRRHVLGRHCFLVFIDCGPENWKTIVMSLAATPAISFEKGLRSINGFCDPGVAQYDLVLVITPFTNELFSLPRFRVNKDNLRMLWIRANDSVMFLEC